MRYRNCPKRGTDVLNQTVSKSALCELCASEVQNWLFWSERRFDAPRTTNWMNHKDTQGTEKLDCYLLVLGRSTFFP